MKQLLIFFLIGLTSCDKLDKKYLPPREDPFNNGGISDSILKSATPSFSGPSNKYLTPGSGFQAGAQPAAYTGRDGTGGYSGGGHGISGGRGDIAAPSGFNRDVSGSGPSSSSGQYSSGAPSGGNKGTSNAGGYTSGPVSSSYGPQSSQFNNYPSSPSGQFSGSQDGSGSVGYSAGPRHSSSLSGQHSNAPSGQYPGSKGSSGASGYSSGPGPTNFGSQGSSGQFSNAAGPTRGYGAGKISGSFGPGQGDSQEAFGKYSKFTSGQNGGSGDGEGGAGSTGGGAGSGAGYSNAQNNYARGQGAEYHPGSQINIIRYDNNPNGGDGVYSYNYDTENGIHAQEDGSGDDNSKTAVGGYSYTSPEGEQITIEYVADGDGYHPKGSHVPQIPEAILKSIELNKAAEARGEIEEGAYHEDDSGEYTNGNEYGNGNTGPSRFSGYSGKPSSASGNSVAQGSVRPTQQYNEYNAGGPGTSFKAYSSGPKGVSSDNYNTGGVTRGYSPGSGDSLGAKIGFGGSSGPQSYQSGISAAGNGGIGSNEISGVISAGSGSPNKDLGAKSGYAGPLGGKQSSFTPQGVSQGYFSGGYDKPQSTSGQSGFGRFSGDNAGAAGPARVSGHASSRHEGQNSVNPVAESVSTGAGYGSNGAGTSGKYNLAKSGQQAFPGFSGYGAAKTTGSLPSNGVFQHFSEQEGYKY